MCCFYFYYFYILLLFLYFYIFHNTSYVKLSSSYDGISNGSLASVYNHCSNVSSYTFSISIYYSSKSLISLKNMQKVDYYHRIYHCSWIRLYCLTIMVHLDHCLTIMVHLHHCLTIMVHLHHLLTTMVHLHHCLTIMVHLDHCM